MDLMHLYYRWVKHYSECAALTIKAILGDLTLVIDISLSVRATKSHEGRSVVATKTRLRL